MKHTHIPKIFAAIVIVFAILLIIGDKNIALGQTSPADSTPAVNKYLVGYAWSSTIGWINLRGSNYGVDVSPTGNLDGFAWSSNLGWISFNPSDVGSCPDGGPCAPTVNLQSGEVTGWARACSGTKTKDCKGESRTDGWDGWIHLSGVNHGSPEANGSGGVTYIPSTAKFNGFAWGSTVVGWVDFSGVSIGNNALFIDPDEIGDTTDVTPPVISQFRMNPALVNKNQSCTMNWEVQNANKCTIIGEGYSTTYRTSLPSGSDKTAAITSAQVYTLNCSNDAGSVSKTAICRLNPSQMEK